MCVQDYDHHCPFLGICVGGRNYRHFFGMVLTGSLCHGFATAVTVAHLIVAGGQGGNLWCQVALLLVSAVSGLPIYLLCGCHTTRFLTHPTEPCWKRFQRKVLSTPYLDLHKILLQRVLEESQDVEKAGGDKWDTGGVLTEVVVEGISTITL